VADLFPVVKVNVAWTLAAAGPAIESARKLCRRRRKESLARSGPIVARTVDQ
jgi:hypothetical protein